MDRQRLEFATEGFLIVMRREFARINSGASSDIKSLGEYPPAGRSALMNSIRKAIELAATESDGAYQTWSDRKTENLQQTP